MTKKEAIPLEDISLPKSHYLKTCSLISKDPEPCANFQRPSQYYNCQRCQAPKQSRKIKQELAYLLSLSIPNSAA